MESVRGLVYSRGRGGARHPTLRTAAADAELGELASRLVVRPVLAIAGARLLAPSRPGGVIVTTPAQLGLLLRELTAQLAGTELARLHDVVRRSTTWSI
jgi:hypothetical protein